MKWNRQIIIGNVLLLVIDDKIRNYEKNIFYFLLAFTSVVAGAQTKGNFEVLDLGSFRLHVYNTNDALGDASYIIEGKTGLVTLEQPLFKDNVSEFDSYVVSLNKPVEKLSLIIM